MKRTLGFYGLQGDMFKITSLKSFYNTKNIFFIKKINDEVTEDIIDMSNVRIFNNDIEKKKQEMSQ